MGRRKKDVEPGEQLQLIDVGPENMKKINPIARRYKAAQRERIQALEEETKAKQELLRLIKESKVKPLDDGSIKFKCDGMTITVTPRDELVRVKEEDGTNADE